MRLTARILTSAVATMFWWGPAARSQEQQWLQYRAAAGARQVVPDMGYQDAEPSPAKPPGIKLPPFRSGRPLFLVWRTPMVASGRIWMAFDQSNAGGDYDRLYLDANANGDLSDDPVYQPFQHDSSLCLFGPVKIVFEGPDGLITYHLSMEVRTYPQQIYCLLSPAGWYEGQISVGGVKKRCLLIDHNVNGTFNDKSRDYNQSDRIRIGEPADIEGGAVGNYVEVDNKLYKVDMARDGAYVVLSEAKDVPYGTVRLAENIATLVVSGENGSFIRKPEKGSARLPVGTYQVNSWSILRKDDAGARWEMKGTFPQGGPHGGLTVVPDKEISIPFGEPIYSTVRVSKSGSEYTFNQRLEGRHGERIVLTRNGSQPPAPRLRITNKEGTYDRSVSSAYG